MVTRPCRVWFAHRLLEKPPASSVLRESKHEEIRAEQHLFLCAFSICIINSRPWLCLAGGSAGEVTWGWSEVRCLAGPLAGLA